MLRGWSTRGAGVAAQVGKKKRMIGSCRMKTNQKKHTTSPLPRQHVISEHGTRRTTQLCEALDLNVWNVRRSGVTDGTRVFPNPPACLSLSPATFRQATARGRQLSKARRSSPARFRALPPPNTPESIDRDRFTLRRSSLDERIVVLRERLAGALGEPSSLPLHESQGLPRTHGVSHNGSGRRRSSRGPLPPVTVTTFSVTRRKPELEEFISQQVFLLLCGLDDTLASRAS